MIKPLAITSIMLALVLFAEGCYAQESSMINISKNSRSSYVIAVAPDDFVANTAARELAEHLKSVTGANFQIVKPEDAGTKSVIAVGPDAALELMPDLELSFSKLGDDGIVLKTSGKNIILTGADGGKRGTLYAAYEFLEKIVGCRWWSPSESYIPKRPVLEIPPLDTVYVPPMYYRELSYYAPINFPEFAAKCRLNGHLLKMPAEYGGSYKFAGPGNNAFHNYVHTAYRLLPPGEYFKSHPEWYSEINGKRVAENAQLCLTNDEMRKELTRKALEWLRDTPDADIISISQNDAYGSCTCTACSAALKRFGTESGIMVDFVNKVAEDIEKEFPNVRVETLAYMYTRHAPPEIKPRHNVIIRLCSIECSFLKSLENDPRNAKFKKDIENWSKISTMLFVWDYTGNYSQYMLPHPNLQAMVQNIPFFVNHKTTGLLEMGDPSNDCGDLLQLRVWVMSRLMWDPSLDGNALIREFSEGYYGPGAKYMMDYISLTQEAAERNNVYLGCYMLYADWLDLSDFNRAEKIFDDAEAAVKNDPVCSTRISCARMIHDYTLMRQWKFLRFSKWASDNMPGILPSADDMETLCKEFNAKAVKFNLRQFAEYSHNRFKPLDPEVFKRSASAGSTPAVCSRLKKDAWFEVKPMDFKYGGYAISTSCTNDPKYSKDEPVAKIPGNHREWTAYPMKGSPSAPIRCYVEARCELKPDADMKGNAFHIILNSSENDKVAPRKTTVGLDKAGDGKYHVYDIGAWSEGNASIAFAGASNPGVSNIYIKRIFFVKNAKAQ